MENFIQLLEIIGLSIYLSLLLFSVFTIVLIVIHILSKLDKRFKVGREVFSPMFGFGKIVLTNSDNVVVRFSNHTQAYDLRGRAVVQTVVRKGLKATSKDNIKAIK